jgi:hypothetical protein
MYAVVGSTPSSDRPVSSSGIFSRHELRSRNTSSFQRSAMLSFATEFPVNHDHSLTSFLRCVRDWIVGSPHTVLKEHDFEGFDGSNEWSAQKANERLEILSHSSGSREQAAARYTRTADGLEWVTTIVFSRWETDSWVGMRVSCESTHPAVRLPPAKKPVLVRVLLQQLGGASDGILNVSTSSHRLENVDIDIAAQLISGRAGCRLPIVYVSSSFQGNHAVDVDRLANNLSGMAHVVVEPNRAFSIRLKIEVDSQNVYGGTIGIYWPDGAGRRSFFLGLEYESALDLQAAVEDEVRSALTNRRPLERSTWASSQALVSRSSFEALKAAGSQEVTKYVEGFDKELHAKAEELADAEREIARLHAEVRKYESRPIGSGIVLRTGGEQDLYPGELGDIVRDALLDALNRVRQDGRRQHIISALIDANDAIGESGRLKEKIKELLRGYSGIDAKVRRGLEDMGFTISEDGKHYKLVFQGDDRYTFTLAKSGSDHRGGLNAASDIARLFF